MDGPRPALMGEEEETLWRSGLSGREVWVSATEKMAETNLMSTCPVGAVVGNLTRTALWREGLDVWERIS